MRLHALRQAPPEITIHPKSPRPQKTNQKTKRTSPNSDNALHVCYITVISPHPCTVRRKLEEPWGAHGGTHACLIPTSPTLGITREIPKKSSTNTRRPCWNSHDKKKTGRGKAWAAEPNARICLNPPDTHNTTCTAASQSISPTCPQHPIPRVWGATEPRGRSHAGARKKCNFSPLEPPSADKDPYL